jgi:alanyl-tRNA synthetase
MRNRIAAIGVTTMMAALLLLGVACEQETTAEKRQTFCGEVAELNAAIQTLEDIGPTSTVGQLKDAEKAVREQANDVRLAFRSLEESKAEDLKQAVDNLQKSANDIPNDATIAEAKATIAQNLAPVRAAAAALTTRVPCP